MWLFLLLTSFGNFSTFSYELQDNEQSKNLILKAIKQKQPPEVFCKKSCKFCKFYRKTSVLEPFFIKFILNTYFEEHLRTSGSMLRNSLSSPALKKALVVPIGDHFGFLYRKVLLKNSDRGVRLFNPYMGFVNY